MTNNSFDKKVLLALMPFWATLTPPLSISCLKGYLKSHGCEARTVDANAESALMEYSDKYLAILGANIPDDKKSNFYMVGFDVMSGHLTAFNNAADEAEYRELVGSLVYNNFYHAVDDVVIGALIDTVGEFYAALKSWLTELFDRERPDVFGVSVYSLTLGPSVFALKLMKELYPGTKTLMGGGVFADQLSMKSPNFQLFDDLTPFIDHIIIGEGEKSLLKLLSGELGDNKAYSLDDGGGPEEISSLPLPDFSDMNMQSYLMAAAFASRSCPFQCGFCSETIQWGAYRKKQADHIAGQMLEISKLYDRRLLMLGDSLLNPVITGIAEALAGQKEKIYWDGYLRIDKPGCDKETVALWREGGYYRARLGLESGSQRVLDNMDKKITVGQTRTVLKNLAEAGIKTTTYWVVGYPGESEDDFAETLAFLREHADYIYEADCHPFYFFPSGQVKSDEWLRAGQIVELYSKPAARMLMTQTWVIDSLENRETIYRRLREFSNACRECGIPNPYSLMDINMADIRWKKLHEASVPSILEFL